MRKERRHLHLKLQILAGFQALHFLRTFLALQVLFRRSYSAVVATRELSHAASFATDRILLHKFFATCAIGVERNTKGLRALSITSSRSRAEFGKTTQKGEGLAR